MESTAEEIEGQTPRKKRKKEKSVEEDKERVEDSDRDVKEKKRKKLKTKVKDGLQPASEGPFEKESKKTKKTRLKRESFDPVEDESLSDKSRAGQSNQQMKNGI